MRLSIYSIYDTKAEEFGPIMTLKNDQVAQRGYMVSVKEYRSDYTLYCLGQIDTETGRIEATNPRLVVVEGGNKDA